jgi:hypothetical protein
MRAREMTNYYERKLRLAREAEAEALADVEAAERVARQPTIPVPLVKRTSSARPPPLPGTGPMPRWRVTGIFGGIQ